MPKGIISPWSRKAPNPSISVAARLSQKARAGKAVVRMRGRLYELHVTLPVTYTDPQDAELAAGLILGKFFASVRPLLEPYLKPQKIFYAVQPLLGPKVTLEFGELNLYVAASSSNLELAEAMALDRLAYALTMAHLTKHMDTYFLSIVRTR